ncbi:deoxycytidyl transferase [Coemansia sp. RSA 1290]|nr:deoxycytidyl transferase [Coemansia sp. RSA 1290]
MSSFTNDLDECSDVINEYQLSPEDLQFLQNRDLTGHGEVVVQNEPTAPEFGDFHTYFDQRKRKLAEQAQKQAQKAPEYRQIFAGVVFHINGFTQPSHYELKKLLIERGGKFLHYLSKTQVTHIIASNLARSKTKELRNYRVVRPEWVVESVRANRLLSWHSYQLGLERGVPMVLQNLLPGNIDLAAGSYKCPNPVPISRPPLPPKRIIVDKYSEGLNRDWVRRNLATEKDFIQRYYASSRLHRLSTWKAEMKDYVAQLRRNRKATKSAGCKPVIMHVDFDCFFVSASLLSYPQFKDKPAAVCHSQSQMQVDKDVSEHSATSSQIASCNYAARSFGVKNGMFIGQARQLCPALVTVPYCFDAYEQISRQFYKIVTQIADETQVVSVDEALLDVSNAAENCGDVVLLAQDIREKVFAATQCTVSIGIGPNILLARLATIKAKPDGVFTLDTDSFFNLDLSVRDLPGVGHVVEETFASRGIKTVGDIRATSLDILKNICGDKTANTLYNFSRGIDNRVLDSDKPRQAFGADIGWGVRFSTQSEAEGFIERLAAEVCRSMVVANRTGSLVTLKIKKRQAGQGKPAKFLGHGICDNLSKSNSLSQMTNDPAKISAACIHLLRQLSIDPMDIRGVGIQVQRLNSLETTANTNIFAKPKIRATGNNANASSKAYELPSASQVDMSIVNELPASIQQELRAVFCQRHDKHDNAPSKSSRSTKANGSRRGRPRKLEFSAGKNRKPAPNLLDSFRKLESLDTIMPSQMDGDVWQHLPVNIRRELAREYVRSKPTKSDQEDAVSGSEPEAPQYSGPTLLGKYRLEDIKALVKEWTSSGELVTEDIDEFAEYMAKLVKHRDLMKAQQVLLYLKLCVHGKHTNWHKAAVTIQDKANQMCKIMYNAQLF